MILKIVSITQSKIDYVYRISQFDEEKNVEQEIFSIHISLSC